MLVNCRYAPQGLRSVGSVLTSRLVASNSLDSDLDAHEYCTILQIWGVTQKNGAEWGLAFDHGPMNVFTHKLAAVEKTRLQINIRHTSAPPWYIEGAH